MVLHPVGSLPPGAYWLRRLLVLVLLVAVVAGGWWLFGRLGSDSGSPTASSSSGPGSQSSTAAANTSSAQATHSASSTPSATHTPTRSASPTATPACAGSAIKVRAQTDASTYAPGVQPRLTIQVSNAGATACQRDLGQAALELVISTGTTRAWSSDDCNPRGGASVVTLRPGQTFSSTVVWDRHRSQPGCPQLPLAKPGSYQLVARNLTLHSAPAPFELG